MSKSSSSTRSTLHHWVVLSVFSVLSIVGNALHALESGAGSLAPWVSASIATIAPITLLASTHSLIVHRRDFSGWTRGVAMSITFLIASASFVLSFSALWELATMAGIPSDRSWLMAVIIDAMVIQATMSLVVSDSANNERPASMAPDHVPTEDASHKWWRRWQRRSNQANEGVDAHRPPVTSGDAVGRPADESTTSVEAVQDDAAMTVDIPEVAGQLAPTPDGPNPEDLLMVLASKVRESSNAVLSREAIAQALQLRLEGHSLREIARAVGVRSHSTIGDWVRVAATFDARFDTSGTEERIDETDAQPLRV